MHRILSHKLLFSTIIALFTNIAYGTESKEDFHNKQVFQLLTVGLGPEMESRFGHTLLHLKEVRREGLRIWDQDVTYNWGTFSFEDPLLPLNFFLGKLKYWLSTLPYEEIMYFYNEMYPRPLWADTLNLSPTQTLKLKDLIAYNLEGDNIYFWYQYFERNCSTLPRDYLNEILDGQIKQHFAKHYTGASYRDYIRRNLNKPPIYSFILELLMNSRVDRAISKWEEMFYPAKLREYLLDFPAIDDQGQTIENKNLLYNSRKLNALKDTPSDDWQIFPLLLLSVPFLLISLFQILRQARVEGASKVILSSFLILWSLFSFVIATVMTASWLWSAHLDLHHNANLCFFWPMDIIYVAYALYLLRSVKAPTWLLSSCFYLSLAHLLSALGAIILWLSGFIMQDIHKSILFALPPLVLMLLGVLWSIYLSSSTATKQPQKMSTN